MLRTLFKLKPRDVPVMVALRNTAAVTLPLAAGISSGHLNIGLGISAGALNTMFSDQPGPYRLRMRRMLYAAAAAGASAFAGYCLGGNDWLIAMAALVWGVCGGMLVALGPDAGRIGLISMILLVVTSADPRAPAQAIGPALLLFGGGVLATGFALAGWPWQRYRPERKAIAQLCRDLAASARGHEESTLPPPVTQALNDVENLLHGSHRARGVAMEAFRILSELIERIRLELLALDGLGERIHADELKSTLARLRDYAGRTLDAIAEALDAAATPLAAAAPLEGFDAAMGALDRLEGQIRERDRAALNIAQNHARALAGQLRAAVRNADFAGSLGELRMAAQETRLPRQLRPLNPLAILRSNMRLSSVAARHAIRCGVCLALAIVGARHAGIPHGYWIPMTTAIVLKPDFAGTLSIGILRVIGTLLGLALATALVHFAFGGDWDRLILLAILCFGFRQLTTMHYGLGVMVLTSLIVVLLSFEGLAPAETMSARAIGTCFGSSLALIAYLLWPTWERGRVRATLADLLDAHRRYFLSVPADEEHARIEARRAGRSARTNAQASLDRLRGEPRRNAQLTALAESVFANANRFVRAAMALDAAYQNVPVRQRGEKTHAFALAVDNALARVTHALRENTIPDSGPNLRSEQVALAVMLTSGASTPEQRLLADAWIDASDRMVDSIDTLTHLLARDGAASTR
ncbi:MAG: FUSC family protein [Rudaea sp.]